MSVLGQYTALNLNSLGSLLQNIGLTINTKTAGYMGSSNNLGNYTPGTTVNDTVLNPLYQAIRDAYSRNLVDAGTYANLINIGHTSIQALGNSKPSLYTRTTTLNPYPNSIPYTSEYTSYGWLRTLPLQAHYEFYINNGSYTDFLSTFNTVNSFKDISNKAIDAFVTSQTHLDGVYSNMNDLISADITGVSLSTFYWGQDLIASGRAIDLSSIATFGNPENLLVTMQKNKALTKAVNLALLSAGLSVDDVSNIINGIKPTLDQQKSIYGAFSIILGTDLADALLPLNCQTPNLTSLADLLNPKMLFPNSYQTLTVPKYNAASGPTNSKTYYLIYAGTDTDAQKLSDYGARLAGILPTNIAIAADAFSKAMLQIKNIQSVNIEKFSQVVTHLENVSTLGVNGTNLPTNQDITTNALSLIANGSGSNNRYTMTDFFGAMSGLSYDWKTLEGYIKQLETAYLHEIYYNLYLAVTWQQASVSVTYSTYQVSDVTYYRVTGVTIANPGGGYCRDNTTAPTITISNGGSAIGVVDNTRNKVLTTYGRVIGTTLVNAGTDSTAVPTATIQSPVGSGWPNMNPVVANYIEQANNEINYIANNNPDLAEKTIVLYNLFGQLLTKEQNARNLALPGLTNLTTGITTTYSFLENINQYSSQTEQYGPAQVLEAISDISSVGGNSLIGSMRESRNSTLLGLTGIELDNGVAVTPLPIPKISGSTATLGINGTVTVTDIGGGGGGSGDIGGVTVINGTGAINTTNVPIITGAAVTPGSMAGSDETALVPDNLNIVNVSTVLSPSTLTPAQAIKDVTDCNCDCWDM